MKVVVFPGVGTNDIKPSHKYFLKSIQDGLGCDGEIFSWEHGHGSHQTNLPLKKTREFVAEVILDFQQVAVHALDMEVPEADIYIGHSAGSILALAQNKPAVIFGSPAALVELIDRKESSTGGLCQDIMKANQNNILNVINKYDILASPLDWSNVENYKYRGTWISPITYFPLSAHIGYWENKKVIKKIVETIKNW